MMFAWARHQLGGSVLSDRSTYHWDQVSIIHEAPIIFTPQLPTWQEQSPNPSVAFQNAPESLRDGGRIRVLTWVDEPKSRLGAVWLGHTAKANVCLNLSFSLLGPDEFCEELGDTLLIDLSFWD
jgi:hypothetical protein